MTYLKELMKEKTPKMSSKISIPGKRYLWKLKNKWRLFQIKSKIIEFIASRLAWQETLKEVLQEEINDTRH
jgi:hypothetical protein